MVISSKGRMIEVRERSVIRRFKMERDPLNELKKIMTKYRFVKVKGLPRFCGGLVGFFGYDTVRFIEEIPDKNPDDLRLADSIFVLTDTMLIFDHVDHKLKIVSNVHVENNPVKAYDDALRRIDELVRTIRFAGGKMKNDFFPFSLKKKTKHLKVKSNVTRKAFQNSVGRAKRYIREGEAIQVVLSQRLEVPVKSKPFEIYRALRSVNPSPYMYYLKYPDMALIGASPEIMVRCEENVVELRPIAGTRPRGASDREDEKLAKELLKDPKERAEHIMLVDLGRNDVGKVCHYDSVKVPELMAIEKYSHVMHIVSDVRGTLRKNKDVFDVMRAAFPAGTVTGAPKVRAMEIIDELENLRRGPYAGSVGYFSFSGNLDSCITIRTVVVKNGIAYIQAGAGIVAYSDPEKEYRETLNKAKALLKAIEFAESGLE